MIAIRRPEQASGLVAGALSRATLFLVLVDFFNSPGGSSEAIRVFLARDLTEIAGGRPKTGEAEEAHLPRIWLPLDEAVDLILAGQLGSPSAVVGILAARAAADRGWDALPSADAPWLVREHLKREGRVHSGA